MTKQQHPFPAGAPDGVAGGLDAHPTAVTPAFEAVTVTAADPRYATLLHSYNHRFVGQPEQIQLVSSTGQVVDAVNAAVAAGKRIGIRGGGHCFEDFTSSTEIKVLLDLSQLSDIYYDRGRRAIAIGAGATLGEVYPTLFKRWGVTIPAGTCFEVGVGGHIVAGGYGPLSRRDGLVVDHLYAVEVVVVDADGRARAVVATREPGDPNRDLWWAHTGGGGGNFGVVTKYWLRSPDVTADDPTKVLPAAPTRIRRRVVMWPWEAVTEAAFSRILRNYCTWYEQNSAPGNPYASLWTNLIVTHRTSGMFGFTAVIDEDAPDAEALLTAHVDAIRAGVDIEPAMAVHDVLPWLTGWLPSYSWPSDPHGRYKNKAGHLRKGFTDHQLATLWKYLGENDFANPTGCLVLTGFGGQVGAVAPDATAVAQRDSILKASYSAGVWQSAEADDANIAWVREFYREIYAGTGGVPVPGEVDDGSYIGYPDVDLADPDWNTSGVGWGALYYKDNYPRLQAIKKRYDPGNVFRHGLSIELPTLSEGK